MRNKLNKVVNLGDFMETLIKIVKLINGYERHYRIEETGEIRIDFVERPVMWGGN